MMNELQRKVMKSIIEANEISSDVGLAKIYKKLAEQDIFKLASSKNKLMAIKAYRRWSCR